MNLRTAALAVVVWVSIGLSASLRAEDLVTGAHAVAVQSDVVYGQGRVAASSPQRWNSAGRREC